MFWGHLRQTYYQHSLHRQTLLLVGSHAVPTPFGIVFLHLYTLQTVSQSLVLGLSSRLTCSQDICSRSAVGASDTLTRSFVHYKFITYLLTDFRKFSGALQITCPVSIRQCWHLLSLNYSKLWVTLNDISVNVSTSLSGALVLTYIDWLIWLNSAPTYVKRLQHLLKLPLLFADQWHATLVDDVRCFCLRTDAAADQISLHDTQRSHHHPWRHRSPV